VRERLDVGRIQNAGTPVGEERLVNGVSDRRRRERPGEKLGAGQLG
jgi:hypothetical protein